MENNFKVLKDFYFIINIYLHDQISFIYNYVLHLV
jgi:hypothetical protein